ncbi:MAG: mechanosensitive ion channel family protein [Polyangiaceae bacterium]
MSTLDGILAEAGDDHSVLLVLGLGVTWAIGRSVGIPRRRLVSIAAFAVLHLALLPIVGALRASGSAQYRDVRLACLIFAGVAAVSMVGVLLFGAVLPRLKVSPPKILQDVIVGVATVFVLLAIAARAGFNLSGLITTSAVLTAVIGLALQDTLGNIVSGLALQTDDSIHVGDWINVGGREGQVSEIRWRYTAIETRDWETVIIPNSQLVKHEVRVLGRRRGAPLQWRRWVHFHVDFRHDPHRVIEVVTRGLRDAPIEGVASEPAPDCAFIEVKESYARFATRYFLTQLDRDFPADSRVLSRIVLALGRAGIPMSMPAHALFLTEETAERKQAKLADDMLRRQMALRGAELFMALPAEEIDILAGHMDFLRFAAGEYLTHQGDRGECLYIITRGNVGVRIARGGVDREVARMGVGSVLSGTDHNAHLAKCRIIGACVGPAEVFRPFGRP